MSAQVKEPEKPTLRFRIETEATVRRVYLVDAVSEEEALDIYQQVTPNYEEDTDEDVSSVSELRDVSSSSD